METAWNNERPVKDGLVPYLMLDDSAGASDFYQKAFAGEELVRMPAEDGKRVMHITMRINNGFLMFNDPFPEHGYPGEKPQGYTLHLQVDDIDTWWKRAIDAGCTEMMPVQDMFWGDRYGQLKDPWGVLWSMGQAIDKG